jgi:hypothetical protein
MVVAAAAVAFVVWLMNSGLPPAARLPDGTVLSVADIRTGTAFHSYPHGVPQRLRSLVPGFLARLLGLGPVVQISFGERLSTGLLVTLKTEVPTPVPMVQGGTNAAIATDRYRVTIEAADMAGALPIVAPGFIPEAQLGPRTFVSRQFFASVPRSARELILKVYLMDDTRLATPLHAFRISNPLGVEPAVPSRDLPPPVEVQVHHAAWSQMNNGIPPHFLEDTGVGFTVRPAGTQPTIPMRVMERTNVWLPTRVVELGDALGNRQAMDVAVREQAPGIYGVRFTNEAMPEDASRYLVVEFAKGDAGGRDPKVDPDPEFIRRLRIPLPGNGKLPGNP